MKYRIFLVEDDEVVSGAIVDALTRWGFTVGVARDFTDVMSEALLFEPHLIIMDIALPFFNGFHWCRLIRQKSTIPIVFLSSRSEDMDIVMGVNLGGDDYIIKPVSTDVLIAKLQAVLRRSYDTEAAAALYLGSARLDTAAACLIYEGKRISLTRNELMILTLLLERKGDVVSREALMERLWQSDEFIDDNTLSVNVNRLRHTLAAAGLEHTITTHKGIGYRIDD